MSDEALASALEADAHAVGVALTGLEIEGLLAFGRLVERWNKAIRIVGPTTLEPIVREQIVDSLGFVPAVRAAGEPAWLDVGAGGGLPGLVLARLCPDLRFVLVEPTAKKTAFLSTAAAALDLQNVVVHAGRVDKGRVVPPLAETPTAALSRATFGPAEWWPLASALVGPGGKVLIATATPNDVPRQVLHDSRTKRWDWRIPATAAPRALFLGIVPGGRDKTQGDTGASGG